MNLPFDVASKEDEILFSDQLQPQSQSQPPPPSPPISSYGSLESHRSTDAHVRVTDDTAAAAGARTSAAAGTGAGTGAGAPINSSSTTFSLCASEPQHHAHGSPCGASSSSSPSSSSSSSSSAPDSFDAGYYRQPTLTRPADVFPYPHRIDDLPLLDAATGRMQDVYLLNIPEGVHPESFLRQHGHTVSARAGFPLHQAPTTEIPPSLATAAEVDEGAEEAVGEEEEKLLAATLPIL